MVRSLSGRSARWRGCLGCSRSKDDALGAMEPPHRSSGRGARLPAKVSARHVCECRAGAGSVSRHRDSESTTSEAVRSPPRTGSVLLLLMLDGSGASAETTPGAETVILLQPTAASPAVRRSLARIRDELSADRFHVVLADSSTAGDPGAVIESAARDAEGGTILALFGDPDDGPGRAVRRPASRPAYRRPPGHRRRGRSGAHAGGARHAGAGAVAGDRAGAFDRDRTRAARSQSRRSPPRADIPPRPTPPAAAPETSLVVAAMGVGIWNSIDGPPPAVTPVGRVGLRLSDWAWARVSVAGLGSRPRVETAYGSADALAEPGAGRICRGVQTRQTGPPDGEPRRRRPQRGRRRDRARRRTKAASRSGGRRRSTGASASRSRSAHAPPW